MKTVLFLIFIVLGNIQARGEVAVDFQKDILPIFETHCYECHGKNKQKSGLRLDLRSAAFKGGNEHRAILPRRAGESPLFTYTQLPKDDEMRMPPKGKGLSQAQSSLLRRWINEGARWPDHLAGEDERLQHWAWQPLQKIRPPTEHDGNPIDYFIRKKLENSGLELSPEADRRTLIRRLSFDLHGIPPSPESVEHFVSDPDPEAYVKLVDDMLASPHFGDRYARHWLDIAHYADTHGFERDKRRETAWRYRDYLIAAVNEDKPYDRFLQEQIAGDVIWPDDSEAVIATGFLAAGPWDFVGQVETKSPILRRSARALDLDDMATQVMTATMGMTVNCARCHDHKLDPISQEEYYQLQAVFAGVKREERIVNEAELKRYEEEKNTLTRQLDLCSFEIGKLEGEGLNLADIVGGGNGLGSGNPGHGLDPRTAKVQTRKFGNLGNVRPNHFAKSHFDFVVGVFVVDGKDGMADVPVSSDGLTVNGLPKTNGQAWDMIRNGPVASQHSNELEGIDFTKDGHSLLGIHANAGITFDLEAIRQSTGLKGMRFTSRAGYFGAIGGHRADLWVLVDGKKSVSFRHLTRERGLQDIDLDIPPTARFLTLIATDGENGYSMDQIGFGDPQLRPSSPPNLNEADRARLSGLRDKQKQLKAKLAELGAPPKFYGVVAVKEMPEVRVQRRGDPESEIGDPLAPGAFATLAMLEPSLGSLSSGEKDRRKALANWITHPGNPLTPRVIVNRLWHWHFGEGLVNTPSDFGRGGGRPSHPELLDWMAAELKRNKWSLKSIHRLILNSQTYQQESRYLEDAPGLSIDAGNRLLWRQNPRRIEAEAVRDAVLVVSGKLNETRGGPGFEDFTYTEAYAPEYNYIVADEPKLWRRSIYRYIVRTTPDRFLTTLDCPDPANFTPKRLTTTTPLQSLALYNNEFMLRQANYFAERIKREAGSNPQDQVHQAFVIAFSRSPQKEEIAIANQLVEREGLFVFCRSLLNANEFVYVD